MCDTLSVEVAAVSSVFWEDLARDLRDPEFEREFATESARIADVDRVVNALDEARISSGMSKAALARAIGAEPATIRRLFSAESPNPTLGTVAKIAAVLGLRVSLEPLAEEEQGAAPPLRRHHSHLNAPDHRAAA